VKARGQGARKVVDAVAEYTLTWWNVLQGYEKMVEKARAGNFAPTQRKQFRDLHSSPRNGDCRIS